MFQTYLMSNKGVTSAITSQADIYDDFCSSAVAEALGQIAIGVDPPVT